MHNHHHHHHADLVAASLALEALWMPGGVQGGDTFVQDGAATPGTSNIIIIIIITTIIMVLVNMLNEQQLVTTYPRENLLLY